MPLPSTTGRLVAKRLAERVVVWLLPDGQPVTFRVAFGLANLARTLAPRPYTLEPVDPPPGRPAPALYYHLDRTDWPDAVGAIAELEADLVSARPVTRPIRLVLPLVRTAAALRVRHTVTALHYDRQITVVATDRSLRMNVRREFFVELPSLITIAPAEEPSLPVELDAQPA